MNLEKKSFVVIHHSLRLHDFQSKAFEPELSRHLQWNFIDTLGSFKTWIRWMLFNCRTKNERSTIKETQKKSSSELKRIGNGVELDT